jgi:hypothetical protein
VSGTTAAGTNTGNGVVTISYINPIVSTTAVLSSSANPSVFGQAVTFTTKVCPSSGTTPPTGTVQFKLEGINFGSAVTLSGNDVNHCSSAVSPSIASLLVGNHPVVVSYTPSGNFAGSTPNNLTQTVNCGTNNLGTGGNLSITSGSVCIIGRSIGGNLNVSGGASVYISNTTIGGGVTMTNPGTVAMCGNSAGGAASISGASGFLLMGGDGALGCGPNTVGNTVTLNADNGGLRVGGNTLRTKLSLTNNTATGFDPLTIGPAGNVVRHNSVGTGLACTGNVPVPSNEGAPNSVTGARTGQCGAGF